MITAVFVNLRRHVWRRQSLVPETTSHVLINIFRIKQTRHILMLYTILFSLLYSIIKHKKMKMSKFSLKGGFRLTAVIYDMRMLLIGPVSCMSSLNFGGSDVIMVFKFMDLTKSRTVKCRNSAFYITGLWYMYLCFLNLFELHVGIFLNFTGNTLS